MSLLCRRAVSFECKFPGLIKLVVFVSSESDNLRESKAESCRAERDLRYE